LRYRGERKGELFLALIILHVCTSHARREREREREREESTDSEEYLRTLFGFIE